MSVHIRSSRMIILLSVVLVLVLASVGRAQSPLSVRIDRIGYDEATDRVQMTITVSDANGTAIRDVTNDNVQVYEDGQLVSKSVSLTVVTGDAQVHIALALDVSGSMAGDPLDNLKKAANDVLQGLSARDKVAVIAFSNEVDLGEPFPRIDPTKEADFTDNKQELQDLVAQLATEPGNTTPLYDALLKAVRMTNRQPKQNRAVILMSDGKDEGKNPGDPGSKVAKPDDSINLAREAGIPIYTIGLGKPQHLDESYLQRAALLTGGFYTRLDSPSDLATAFEEVVKRLKTEYLVSYVSPAGPDGELHEVLVNVALPAVGNARNDPPAHYTAPLPEQPLIKRIYYWEGTNKRELREGQQIRSTRVRLTPESLCKRPIAKVEYYLDDATVPYVVSEAPFEFEWRTARYGEGIHTLTVKAYDTASPPNVGMVNIQLELVRAPWDKSFAGIPAWAIALVLLLMAAGILILLIPKKRRCPTCGRVMGKGWEYCLFCQQEAADTRLAVTEDVGGEQGMAQAVSEGFGLRWEAETRQAGMEPSTAFPRDKTVVLHKPPEKLAYLIVQSGHHVGHQFRLESESSIGRAEMNSIVLDDPAVGRQQCKIKLEQGDFYIYDLASTNPTLVNGQKILKHKLADGDRIQVGNTALVFKVI